MFSNREHKLRREPRWKAFWRALDVGSLFDPQPLADISETTEEARRRDYEALRGDWERVGGYLRNAMRQYERKTK